MSPPAKRPRLSCFSPSNSDQGFQQAQARIDRKLKSRFEQIFEKYSKDFSNIGDEIDLETGEVVVNNGHLEAMKNEQDLGLATTKTATQSDTHGRSLLRAMTVAPESSDFEIPGTGDVIQSIEDITDHVIVIDDSSEDELFDSLRPSSEMLSRTRSSSVDSLFDTGPQLPQQPPQKPHKIRQEQNTRPVAPREREPIIVMSDEELRRKVIQEEIRTIMSEQMEANVEEAWRVPVRITPTLTFASRKSQSYYSSNGDSPSLPEHPKYSNQDSDDEREPSLWGTGTRHRRSKKMVAAERHAAAVRADSADPLQEGFDSDASEVEPVPAKKRQRSRVSTVLEIDEDTQMSLASTSEAGSDEVLNHAQNGHCPFYLVHYADFSGVMTHWDRWLRKDIRHKPLNDPHDENIMKGLHHPGQTRNRGPRLTIEDWFELIYLHEDQRKSFETIAKDGCLRTRKSAAQLHDFYDQHRTVALPNGFPPPRPRWQAHEDAIIRVSLKRPDVTFNMLKRQLPGKDEVDIGNRLAECFLDWWRRNLDVNAMERSESVRESEDGDL